MIARYQPQLKESYAPPKILTRARKGPRKAETYRAARRNAMKGNRVKRAKNERLVMKQVERKE